MVKKSAKILKEIRTFANLLKYLNSFIQNSDIFTNM